MLSLQAGVGFGERRTELNLEKSKVETFSTFHVSAQATNKQPKPAYFAEFFSDEANSSILLFQCYLTIFWFFLL